MSHLTHDEFVLTYYDEPDLGSDRREHLATCEQCRAELASLSVFLDRVTPVEAPEPDADYETRTWERLQWRMRGEKRKRTTWMKWVAAAAVVALAFIGGLLWNRRDPQAPVQQATTTSQPAAATPASTAAQQQASRDRVLLVVVGEHMDQSERILVELTNITPDGNTDITTERLRAEELLASNRIYKRSALDRGEDNVATILDQLEPILMQIAHSPSDISAEELRRMQKRVEAKGIVFKLRVVRADVHRDAGTPSLSTNI